MQLQVPTPPIVFVKNLNALELQLVHPFVPKAEQVLHVGSQGAH